ncbi:MAG: NAD(P)H-dependent oxidoreductase [Candidatus Thorarchaeota archaeon]
MKIVVLNGSPKGNMSATMQYILYIQKKYPYHELEILNIAQKIKKLESNEEKFQEVIEKIERADGVIWGTPLYVLLVPSQYKKFIELIYERKVMEAFKNKYTIVITTSIHFYDHTAIKYMNGICDDLEMNYVGSFTAEMFDLMIPKKREHLLLFAENFFNHIEQKLPTSRSYPSIKHHSFEYKPNLEISEDEKINVDNKKIVILTDSNSRSINLTNMIERFRNSFSKEIQVINISDIDIKGGCLGCIQCGYDNTCVYEAKDGFTEFWNSLESYDIIVFAGVIKDRFLSSRWKLILDRSFFKGHAPSLNGKQFGLIISGPLGQIPNIREYFSALIEMQKSNLVDIITDEYQDSKETDTLLSNLAKSLISFSKSGYIKPESFLYVGGFKVLRDAVFGRMRFVFQADHHYYEEHGYYDFPHDDERAKKMNDKFIPLTQNEKFRKVFYSRLASEMINPLKSVIENPDK